METQIKREWQGDVFFTHGTNSARGVAVLINSRLECSVKGTRSDNEGRVLNVLLDLEDHTINIVNVCAPSSGTQRRIFFSNLEKFISSDYDNLIGGDFNCIMNTRLNKLGGDPNPRQTAVFVLNTFNARYDLCDVWTGRNLSDNSFIRTRLDFFLITTSAEIKPYAHSDHDCISLAFDFDKIQRGPGFWHFNNELLTDALFEEEIEQFWAGWQEEFQNFPNPLKWWDTAKHNFKTIAIRRAKIRGKLLRHERFQLENKLSQFQERAKNGTTRDIEQHLLAKEKLKQLDLKDLDATKIRTKAQFMEEGEKSTRYFLSLEKSRKANQTIHVLTNKRKS